MFRSTQSGGRTPLKITLLGVLAVSLTGVAPLDAQQPPPLRLPETVVPGDVVPGAVPIEPPPSLPGGPRRTGFGSGSGTSNVPGPIYDSPFSSPPTPGQGYSVENSSTGTKISIPQIDFAGTVNVIPSDLLRDQFDVTTTQALRNVPGVGFQGGSGGREDNVFLRGFSLGFFDSFRKDGILDVSRVERDLANIDRIEVLKGPASFLYGASATPAGIINYITKKPLSTPYEDATFQVGSFNYYRFTTDMTGPIREGSPILYRLNVSTEDADSFRDFVYEDRAFIAPSFSVPLGDRTLLTVETEYLHDNRIMDRGVPFYKFNALAVPINVFEGEPDDRSRFNNERIQFILDHRFNDNWALRANYASGWSDEYRINTDTRTLSTTNPLLLTRAYVLQDTQDSSHFGTIDLAGDVGKDTIKQHLLFGTELGTQLDNTRSGGPSAPSVNIFNPNYTPGYFKPAIVPNLTGDSQKSQFAFYGQDLIELSPYVKFVVGTRWTDYNQLSLVKPITEESNYVWIPHVGVSLEPIPEKLSFYVAYGTSFNPVIGFTSSFQPLVPETGWSYEYGIKAKLTDRLTMTLAGYRIVEQNVPETDPTNPLFSVQIGAVASQGFEGQLEGKLTERWSISTSYSYIATEVLSDTNKALIGHRLQAVPDYTVNLWTRYNLIQNEQRVLGFAVGCYGLGYEYADNLNLYRVPSFTRWDCGFYYTEGRLGTSLYVENIGDVHYIASSQSNAILQPGAPTTLRAMISWRF